MRMLHVPHKCGSQKLFFQLNLNEWATVVFTEIDVGS